MRFLQITFGYIVGRLAIIALLLPLYFRGEPFTAYEVLERRFGKASRRVSSLLFIVTRNLADALRLYLAALVLQEAMGLEMRTCIIIVGAVTVTYTYLGGVKSVVWNDCIQFTIYIIGAVVILYKVLTALPGGWEQFWQYGVEHDKFRVFDFDWSLYKPSMTFWAGLIGGMFLTGSTHGTDHLTVQRLLAARSQREAGVALGLSGFIVCLQFALFLIDRRGAGLLSTSSSTPMPPLRPQQGRSRRRPLHHPSPQHADRSGSRWRPCSRRRFPARSIRWPSRWSATSSFRWRGGRSAAKRKCGGAGWRRLAFGVLQICHRPGRATARGEPRASSTACWASRRSPAGRCWDCICWAC